MCEDYPCCGHDQNDCPEQSMEQDYGWSLDDWDDTPLTPEEQAAEDRSYYQQLKAEADAEFLMSPYAFD